MFQRSPRQSVSPYKSHIKNPQKINYPLLCSPLAKSLPSNFQEMGILQAPPPFLSHSYPPFSRQLPPQPPLLPLPAADPRRRATTRGVSCPLTNKKTNINNRTRDSPLTPKRPSSSNNPKKENNFSPKKPSDCVIISSTVPLGPDPNHLPQTVTKLLPSITPVSPPPSSLPLPRFSFRPNLSCKVEAGAGIDTGATEDLRRILRLR